MMSTILGFFILDRHWCKMERNGRKRPANPAFFRKTLRGMSFIVGLSPSCGDYNLGHTPQVNEAVDNNPDPDIFAYPYGIGDRDES